MSTSHQQQILVTGGLGFIGSHTVVELIKAGFDPVIVDNLSNSKLFILERIEAITGVRPKFYQGDVCSKEVVQEIFKKEKNIAAVIHFAAFKSVNESIQHPLRYFQNNLYSLLNLLECMNEFNVANLVFSSSATVYGQPDVVPTPESAPFKKALSAYGSTKQMGEEILEQTTAAAGLNVIALRYFNPVGAHRSGLIGELPNGVPNNLMPFLTQVAAGLQKELVIHGNDYDTKDGTCVRDYIHVVDLAKAHVKSCSRLLSRQDASGYEVFNLGMGKGISVLEMIEAFNACNGTALSYRFGPRRAGDAQSVYADTTAANQTLNWSAELGLEEMVTSAWRWQQAVLESDYPIASH